LPDYFFVVFFFVVFFDPQAPLWLFPHAIPLTPFHRRS
jgi:hypothetical protein